MSRFKGLRLCVASICVVGLAVGGTAHAESGADPASSNAQPAGEQAGNLAEVIVTAQKRSENLQDVPIAVTALTGSDLASVNVNTSLALPKITPNLSVAFLTSYAEVYIRGIGTSNANPGLESSVPIYLDDVYIPRASGGLFSLNDVDRLEVLKGPQVALYGRNAIGGVIRIVTNDPKDEFQASGSATLGSFNTRNVEGMVNVPIAPDLAVRFTAQHSEDDGFVRNIAPGGGQSGANRLDDNDRGVYTGKLRFESGRLTVKLNGDYTQIDDTAGSGLINLYSAPEQVGALAGGCSGTGFYVACNDAPVFNHVKAGGVSVRLDYDADFANLSSISAYRYESEYTSVDLDATGTNIQSYLNYSISRQWTQEFEIASKGSGPLTYVAGLYFLGEHSQDIGAALGSGTGAATGGFGLQGNSAGIHTTSVAPYAQAEYAFIKELSLTAGIRYTNEKKQSLGNPGNLVQLDPVTGQILPGGIVVVAPAGNCTVPGELLCLDPPKDVRFNEVSPHVSLSYKPADQMLLYATYSRGFKSGGFNTPAFGYVGVLQPETLDDYEIGWKLERGNVRWNGSAFYYKYQNLQVQVINAQSGGVTAANAASALDRGVESDVTWAAAKGLDFGVGGGYLNAKYKDFPAGQIFVSNAPSPGLTQIANVDLSGRSLINAPHFTGYVRASYRKSFGNAGTVQLSGVLNYRSNAYFDSANQAADPSRLLGSARLTWTAPGDRFFVALSGENLTNKKYSLLSTPQTTGGFYVPAPPREVFVQAGYSFD